MVKILRLYPFRYRIKFNSDLFLLCRVRKRKHRSTEEVEEEGVNYKREEKREDKREDRREDRREDYHTADKEKRKKLSDKERERQEASERRREMAKKAPPPLDFQSLLKMATSVKDLPVQVKSTTAKKEVKESSIGNRPMTKKVIANTLRKCSLFSFFLCLLFIIKV